MNFKTLMLHQTQRCCIMLIGDLYRQPLLIHNILFIYCGSTHLQLPRYLYLEKLDSHNVLKQTKRQTQIERRALFALQIPKEGHWITDTWKYCVYVQTMFLTKQNTHSNHVPASSNIYTEKQKGKGNLWQRASLSRKNVTLP